MIYRYGKRALGYALDHYFRRITVLGDGVESGPVLIVANHQNMALDPFLLTRVFRRDLFFLAKSTLFRGPLINRWLTACHLIPVYRRQDNPGDVSKNHETFRAAVEYLNAGKGVALFPEGISMGVRRLEDLKTGAARIAFQAEDGANFKLGALIQPVGITYSDLDLFHGTVTVRLGTPIRVSDSRVRYESDAVGAVRELTEQIETALRGLVVDIANDDHSELTEKIAKIYRQNGSALDDFQLFEQVASHVERLAPQREQDRFELERRIDSYFELAEFFGLGDADQLVDERARTVLLLSPFIILGVLFFYLPYRLSGKIARHLSTHPSSAGSVKFGIGVLIFGLWYLLCVLVLLIASGSIIWTVAGAALLWFCGVAASRWYERLALCLLSHVWPGSKKPVDLLRMFHAELVGELERHRNRPEPES